MNRILQKSLDPVLVIPAGIFVIGVKYDLQSDISFEYLWNLVAVGQPRALMLQVEVLVDVEWWVLLDMKPEVAGMCFWAELEGMISDEFVVDLHLNGGGFFLAHGKYN